MFENKSNYDIIQIEKRRLIMRILHLADLHLGKILQEQSFLEDQKYMLNKIIEKKEQFISELENYKKSLIYEYVTGKKEVPES